jgi:hypothetical protein
VPSLPIVPGTSFEDAICGLHVDALDEHDPSGAKCEQLLRAVEDHVRGESSALVQYEQLATGHLGSRGRAGVAAHPGG